jgi:hypothetical protein
MAHTDWIPRKEQDLVDLCEKWTALLGDAARIAAYGWDQSECAGVSGTVDGFLSARYAYKNDDSSAKRLLKDEAKAEAVDAMREFANSSIRYNKKMSDADKLVMGIRPADTTLTTHPVPASQPETVVENTTNHFEHKIKALNRGRKDASKPADAYGVRYAWQVGGERPVSGADLPKTKFSRKTSHVVTHSEADKAKTAYYATCYENAKGDTGPWSPVEEAVIG